MPERRSAIGRTSWDSCFACWSSCGSAPWNCAHSEPRPTAKAGSGPCRLPRPPLDHSPANADTRANPAMTRSSSLDATDPRDLLRLLRRRGWILLLCVIVIPAAVYVYSERLTKIYSSTVIVQPQATADPAQILSGNASAPQNTAGVASLAKTSSVRTTAERLH